MPRLVAIGLLFVLVSSASAQIIYEPVEYQYRAEGTIYYYGGDNPAVHAYAAEPITASHTWGRVHGLAFGSGDLRVHREVTNEPERVFSDSWHRGLQNARLVGYTPDDARNEAMQSLPGYYRKSDLLASAERGYDGVWRVPAHAPTSSGTVTVYKSSGQRVDVAPKSMPRPLMIIPKDQLQQPDRPSDKTVAKAD
jgi:hypothetical protein